MQSPKRPPWSLRGPSRLNQQSSSEGSTVVLGDSGDDDMASTLCMRFQVPTSSCSPFESADSGAAGGVGFRNSRRHQHHDAAVSTAISTAGMGERVPVGHHATTVAARGSNGGVRGLDYVYGRVYGDSPCGSQGRLVQDSHRGEHGQRHLHRQSSSHTNTSLRERHGRSSKAEKNKTATTATRNTGTLTHWQDSTEPAYHEGSSSADAPSSSSCSDVNGNSASEWTANTSGCYVPTDIGSFLSEYEIIRQIGSGSVGQVFHVGSKKHHPALKGYSEHQDSDTNNSKSALEEKGKRPLRDLAVKVVDKSQFTSEKSLGLLLQEVAIHRSAVHPHVAQLYTAFDTKKSTILVQHYYPRGDLATCLERAERYTYEQTARYCSHLTMALDYLHKQLIVFRDLKPENILISENDEFVLTDFGLSVILQDPDDRATTFCGTPEYLAPEIILNHCYGVEVDWWALGMIVCELATGSIPFTAEALNENYSNIIHCRMFPTLQLKVKFLQLEPALKSLIMGLLTRDHARRFKAKQVQFYLRKLGIAFSTV